MYHGSYPKVLSGEGVFMSRIFLGTTGNLYGNSQNVCIEHISNFSKKGRGKKLSYYCMT
jgi:hypothetical protein